MKNQEYRNKIDDLHAHLESVKEQEDVSPEKIEEIQSKIKDVFEQTDIEHTERHASLVTVLEDAARHFQISHPALTSFLNTIISDLNALGI